MFTRFSFHCMHGIARYGSHPGELASAPLPRSLIPLCRRPDPCTQRHTAPRPGPAWSGSRRSRSTPRCSPTAPLRWDSTTCPGAGLWRVLTRDNPRVLRAFSTTFPPLLWPIRTNRDLCHTTISPKYLVGANTKDCLPTNTNTTSLDQPLNLMPLTEILHRPVPPLPGITQMQVTPLPLLRVIETTQSRSLVQLQTSLPEVKLL